MKTRTNNEQISLKYVKEQKENGKVTSFKENIPICEKDNHVYHVRLRRVILGKRVRK
jgi:hypothetical protein